MTAVLLTLLAVWLAPAFVLLAVIVRVLLEPAPPALPVPVDCLSDAEVSVLFDDLVDLGGLR